MVLRRETAETLSARYSADGFVIAPVYSKPEFREIEMFTHNWLAQLWKPYVDLQKNPLELGAYHQWFEKNKIPHGELFRAANRHTTPSESLRSILLNDSVRQLLHESGIDDFDLWDEGLGWLAFRIVRPGFADGYPISRKEWGPAKTVHSFWIPVIGFSRNETLGLVPGSHIQEYPHYLPKEQKFRHDEFRLSPDFDQSSLNLNHPDLGPGDAIMYHPRVLHSEESRPASKLTRISLEFRVLPKTSARSTAAPA